MKIKMKILMKYKMFSNKFKKIILKHNKMIICSKIKSNQLIINKISLNKICNNQMRMKK